MSKTEKTIKREIIETVLSKGSQDIIYRHIYKENNLKIKLEIRSDGCKKQCYARAYVLSNLEWSLIYSIPYSEMKTQSELAYKNNVSEASFLNDKNLLQTRMTEILF